MYILVTWYSLHQSAKPVRGCSSSSENCFTSLVSPGDVLSVQLFFLYQPNNSNSNTGSYQWMPIDTCRMVVTIPHSSSGTTMLPVDIAGGNNNNNNNATTTTNCTVALPDSARLRHANNKPLRAKFRFQFPNNGPVAADVPFELTRIIQRSSSTSFWTGDASNRRNLMEKPLGDHDDSGNDDDDASDGGRSSKHSEVGHQWIPYLKYSNRASIRIRFVAEYRPFGALLREDGIRLEAFDRTRYRPMIYVDDNSLQHSAQIELAPPDANKPPISLRIKFGAVSPITDAMNQQVVHILGIATSIVGEAEIDELRYFLQDEKLYRFVCSQTISFVHVWLDYLAFRDEVRFYRGRENLKGVSASSLISQLVCSIVILLYLLDGGGTSWVVLVSLLSSCSVEAWKVKKLLRPRLVPRWPFVALRQLDTTEEENMAEFDRIAAKRLAMVLYPTVAIWSLYALRTYSYTSWWSWFISNLANAVYTFGFISLCPQLYVNYRLKSVAHLPWKVFVYKIFNTFVDDAFAWLIVEMPLKHRLMTLRDDVVFLVLLYQAYIYRVDKSRTNEYGYSYDDDHQAAAMISTESEHDDASALAVKTTTAPTDATTTTPSTDDNNKQKIE